MSYNAEDRAYAQGTSRHEHRKATRKMRWWYESLADFIMANPRATQNDMSAHFGRTAATISTIVNTDAFKAYLRQRRDHHAEILDASVRGKLMNVADTALDMMLEHLERKRDTIPLDQLQRVTETTLKSLGYGASAPTQTNVTVNTTPQMVNVAVGIEDLERARAALRNSQMQNISPPPLTIDHERPQGLDDSERSE